YMLNAPPQQITHQHIEYARYINLPRACIYIPGHNMSYNPPAGEAGIWQKEGDNVRSIKDILSARRKRLQQPGNDPLHETASPSPQPRQSGVLPRPDFLQRVRRYAGRLAPRRETQNRPTQDHIPPNP